MEPETFEGGYPVEPYTEVISGLFQASAAPSPAQMLSMFDILIDVGGRDRWDLGRLHPPPWHDVDSCRFRSDLMPSRLHPVGSLVARSEH